MLGHAAQGTPPSRQKRTGSGRNCTVKGCTESQYHPARMPLTDCACTSTSNRVAKSPISHGIVAPSMPTDALGIRIVEERLRYPCRPARSPATSRISGAFAHLWHLSGAVEGPLRQLMTTDRAPGPNAYQKSAAATMRMSSPRGPMNHQSSIARRTSRRAPPNEIECTMIPSWLVTG